MRMCLCARVLACVCTLRVCLFVCRPSSTLWEVNVHHFSPHPHHPSPSHPHPQTPGTLWEVNVHMERWLVGAQLTLNFFGDSLKKHPLRVSAYMPSDAVNEVSLTAHSISVELRNSPVHEFNIQAYGLAEVWAYCPTTVLPASPLSPLSHLCHLSLTSLTPALTPRLDLTQPYSTWLDSTRPDST